MLYQMLVISRIETDTGDVLVVATFYPTPSACIKPRTYETLVASYACAPQPGIELADVLSEKGKHRLKILLRNPTFTDEERRTKGAAYYSLLFGQNCGRGEAEKGTADKLYQAMCGLCTADAGTEDGWTAACASAIATFQRAASAAYPASIVSPPSVAESQALTQ